MDKVYSRYTDEELTLIKSTFKENETLLKLMRKVLLPELDYGAPLGTVGDVWMGLASQLEHLSPYDRELAILARIKLIYHVEGALMELDRVANEKIESKEAQKARAEKDSVK